LSSRTTSPTRRSRAACERSYKPVASLREARIVSALPGDIEGGGGGGGIIALSAEEDGGEDSGKEGGLDKSLLVGNIGPCGVAFEKGSYSGRCTDGAGTARGEDVNAIAGRSGWEDEGSAGDEENARAVLVIFRAGARCRWADTGATESERYREG
jgi:hypothetical protein